MPSAQHFFGAIAALLLVLDALTARVTPSRARCEILGFGTIALRRQIPKTLVTAESADPNKNSPLGASSKRIEAPTAGLCETR